MKFVCDECNTKYSIADEKVRRKVLKIRCKNCSHIIVVRELDEGSARREGRRGSSEAQPLELERSGLGRLQERPFDAGFRPGSAIRNTRSSQSAPVLKVTSSLIAPAELEEPGSEATRLSGLPDFPGPDASAAAAGAPEDEWYLATDGNQFGPMAFAELCQRVRRGEALGEAYVWRDGFDDWLELQEVPELKPFLPRVPPPPPRGKSGLFPSPKMPLVSALPTGMPPVPSLPGTPYPPHVALPTLPRPVAPVAPPSVPLQSVPSSSLPPGYLAPAPAGLPVAPTPAAGFDLHPSGDSSGMAPLPIPAMAASLPSAGLPAAGFGDPSAYSLSPVAPVTPPRSSTPLLLKITAAAGVASLLCGIGLVAYFIFFDRPTKPARVGIAIPAATDPTPVAAASAQPSPQPRAPEPQEFQPMEIAHSGRPTKARVASAHKETKAPVAVAPAPALDEEGRRLMKLYGKGGEAKAAEAPVPAAPAAKKHSSPRRQISENDILGMQRKHRPALTACYDRALKRDETLNEMKADVTVTIDDRGLVKNVAITGVRDEELAGCLRKNIKYWAFEPLGEQTFRFPIIFRGS